jgi:hypothetical protein
MNIFDGYKIFKHLNNNFIYNYITNYTKCHQSNNFQTQVKLWKIIETSLSNLSLKQGICN